jgi:hypothetical protein
MKWQHNDNLFFKELKEGFKWQQLPALFFTLHGCNVDMPDLSIRESIKEAHKWLGETDMLVNGQYVEIKSRNEPFTDFESFPYATIFVDTVSGYDAKETKPIAYVMISRPTGAMLCIKGDQSNAWSIERKFDRTRKIWDDFYMCPKSRLQTMDVLISFLKK